MSQARVSAAGFEVRSRTGFLQAEFPRDVSVDGEDERGGGRHCAVVQVFDEPGRRGDPVEFHEDSGGEEWASDPEVRAECGSGIGGVVVGGGGGFAVMEDAENSGMRIKLEGR